MGRSFTGVCQQAHPVRLAPRRSPHLTTIYDIFIAFSHRCRLDIYFKTQEMKCYSCEGGISWSLYDLLSDRQLVFGSPFIPPKSSNPSRLHNGDPSGRLLEGEPGNPDHFSHPPLGGVFIPVDEGRKLSLSKFGRQTLRPETFQPEVTYYAFLLLCTLFIEEAINFRVLT